MTRTEANSILDSVRIGTSMPSYIVNQALMITGDLAQAPFSLADALEAAKQDREKVA